MGESSGGPGPPEKKGETMIMNYNDNNIDHEEIVDYNTGMTNNAKSSNEIIKIGIQSKVIDQKKYRYTDTGPFIIYMQGKTAQKNVGNYHFLQVAKYVYTHSTDKDGIKNINKKGKNRISIEFKSYQAANEFLDNNKVKEDGYEIFIPNHNISCRGVIGFVDLEFTKEELEQFSEVKKVNTEILNIRRLNRKIVREGKSEYVGSGSVCYTFTGKQIPKEVYICGIPFRVKPYIMPVVQCYGCFLYGHVKNHCKSTSKCKNCGEKEHEGTCEKKCYHCNSKEHYSFNSVCPEYARQKYIKELMSLDNLTYYEANEIVPMIENKRKNKQTFQKNNNEFPALGKETDSEFITIAQRRSMMNETLNKNSYSNVVNENKKRRTTNNTYDKEGHNACLSYQNGRFNTIENNGVALRRDERSQIGEK